MHYELRERPSRSWLCLTILRFEGTVTPLV